MEQVLDTLVSYGPWGMFVAAFLAGSVIAFSSETVMIALLAVGVDPWILLIAASAGNTLGGISCYCLGRLANPDWVQRKFRIKEQHMQRAHRLVERWGAWMGFFCWLPIIGDALLLTLGIMRSNPILTNLTMIIGRTLRYAIVLLSAIGIGQVLG